MIALVCDRCGDRYMQVGGRKVQMIICRCGGTARPPEDPVKLIKFMRRVRKQTKVKSMK